MSEPKRIKQTERAASRQSTSWPTNNLLKALEDFRNACQEMADEYRRSARRASRRGHTVEAAIGFHISDRFSAPGTTMEERLQTVRDVAELSKWLPRSADQTQQSVLERSAEMIQLIRRQKIDGETKSELFALATQRPGRPATTRGAAVRAMELHASGRSWAQIEKQLLPHRRDVVNSGRSINREVQLLKAALNRYGVRV